MKKVIMNLIALSLIVFSLVSSGVEANAMVSQNEIEYTKEYFDNKFKELFPEYVEKMELCNELAIQNIANRNVRTYAVSSGERIVTESVTRYDGDDVYALTFYSNGAYSEAALLTETVTIEFEKGTQDQLKWMNCKVYTTLMDPGWPPYMGGIIGDGITYFKDGHFSATGYGNYINQNLDDDYIDNIVILSKTSSQVKVVRKAVATVLGGQYETEMVADTLLTITLNANSNPTITFGYW